MLNVIGDTQFLYFFQGDIPLQGDFSAEHMIFGGVLVLLQLFGVVFSTLFHFFAFFNFCSFFSPSYGNILPIKIVGGELKVSFVSGKSLDVSLF